MTDLQAIIDKYRAEADQAIADSVLQFRKCIIARSIDMMKEAENCFGPRDLSFSIEKITFDKSSDGKAPFTAISGVDSRIIYLGVPDENWREASMRLAHELTHCLAPNRSNKYTVLEEGCACHLGCYFGGGNFMPGDWEVCHKHLAHIRRKDTDIIKKIRANRLSQGKGVGLSEIDVTDVSLHLPADAEIIENLGATFDPGNGQGFFPNKTQYVV